MQCNTMQCNTRNAMQCNAMQCIVRSPSVRTEWWSQSVFFIFFIFFFSQYVRSPYVRNTNVTDGQTISFSYFSVSMYECHGWTDKFQLFQFSFSSVAYSQVSLSVRTEVPTKKRKKKICYRQTKQIRSEVITPMAKILLLNLSCS
jgi:hypothetical protein